MSEFDEKVLNEIKLLKREVERLRVGEKDSTAYMPYTMTDGWTHAIGWVIYDTNTIYVFSGAATTFSVGDKIKVTNGSVKYFSVIAISNDDAIRVSAGSNNALVGAQNTSLNDCYYSHQASPVGFPPYFNYALTQTGWEATPTIEYARFSMKGAQVFVEASVNGTSNASAKVLSLPIDMGHYRYAFGFSGNYSIGGTQLGVSCGNNGASVTDLLVLKSDGSSFATSGGLVVAISGDYFLT